MQFGDGFPDTAERVSLHHAYFDINTGIILTRSL